MLDFLTGFLLGIVFAIALTLFGIYKLLLKEGDHGHPHLPSHPSFSQIQFSKHVKHNIQKYTNDENHVNMETCAWINTIAASLCVEALSSPVLVESLNKKLHEILNKPEDKPDVLGKIIVSDINMGSGLPSIQGIRVISRSSDDTLNAEVKLQYNGGASFNISTELWMNWPTPKFAALPVSLQASFDHFEGILSASCFFHSPTKSRVTLFLPKPPALKLRIGSTIGHSTKLVNVTKVSALIETMIYKFVNTELVAPGGFELDVEGGKVCGVRKLAEISPPITYPSHKLTEKGERFAIHPHQDLSRRSFSVSTGES